MFITQDLCPEPPYGSTEGALKGRRKQISHDRAGEPPYGSTEGALKGRREPLS